MNPRRLVVKNFLSYAEETFDFTNYNGLVLITGINSEMGSKKESNGAGKSSVFDAITWCLFGRVRNVFDKSLIKDDIIRIIDSTNARADECNVEFEFEINDKIYKVIRNRRLKSNTALELYVLVNNEWQSLSLKSNVNKETDKRESAIIKTEKQIEDILNCSCDLFINSVLFEQGNTNTFAVSSKLEKQNLFTDILSLNKWYRYAQLGKDKTKIAKLQLASIENSLRSFKTVEEIEQTIIELNTDLENNKLELINQKKILADVNTDINKITLELSQFESNQIKLKELETSVASLSLSLIRDQNSLRVEQNIFDITVKKLACLVLDRDELKLEIDESLSKIDILKSQISVIDVAAIESSTARLNEINIENATISTKVSILNEKKDNTRLIDCPVLDCPHNSIANVEQKIKVINTEIFGLNAKKSKNDKEKNNLEAEVKIFKDIQFNNTKLERDISKLESDRLEYDNKMHTLLLNEEKTSNEINMIKLNITSLENNINTLTKNIVESTTEITNLKSNLSNYESLTGELKALKDRTISITACIEELISFTAYINNHIKTSKESLIKVNELTTNYKTLEFDLECSKRAIDVLSKEIPHLLIETAIPEIEQYTNEFLERISAGRMSLKFITEKELQSKDADGNQMLSDAFDLELSLDEKTCKYGLFSGGERCRADIALHLAYSAFLVSRGGYKFETLFLDEISASLDAEGSDTLIDILLEMITEYGFKKIFIISQDEKMKNRIDNVITIVKTENGSKIK